MEDTMIENFDRMTILQAGPPEPPFSEPVAGREVKAACFRGAARRIGGMLCWQQQHDRELASPSSAFDMSLDST